MRSACYDALNHMTTASKNLIVLSLLLGALAWAQTPAPAPQRPEDPNAAYRTREGRERIAAGLDNPSRAETMRFGDLVALLKLKPGDSVADIGTGTGQLVPLLSQAVGAAGRVYAEDIFPDFLEKVREKVGKEHLANVTPVLGTETNPLLPRNQLAAAVIVDAYHHFEHPREMLAGISDALGPAGRLVIMDFFRSEGPSPGHIRKDQDEVAREIEQNGFHLESISKMSPRQYVLEFTKSRK